MDGRSKTESSKWLWVAPLVALCAAIIAHGYFYSTNAQSEPAFLLGYYLPIAFFIWLAFYALTGRREEGKWISFFSIYFALTAGATLSAMQQKQEALLAITEIEEGYSAAVAQQNEAQGSPGSAAAFLDTTPKAQGEFGEMERFMKSFVNATVALRNDYQQELAATRWNTILDVERISKPDAIADTRRIASDAVAVAKKYEAKTDQLYAQGIKDIQKLDMSAATKAEMTKGFTDGLEKSGPPTDETWSLELLIILAYEKAALVLARDPGGWVHENGRYLFHDQRDLDEFNEHMMVIQRLGERQVETATKSAETVQTGLNQLKQMSQE